MKMKENEKLDKYLDLGWNKKKKWWNIMGMVIPSEIEVIGTVRNDLEKRGEELEEDLKHRLKHY